MVNGSRNHACTCASSFTMNEISKTEPCIQIHKSDKKNAYTYFWLKLVKDHGGQKKPSFTVNKSSGWTVVWRYTKHHYRVLRRYINVWLLLPLLLRKECPYLHDHKRFLKNYLCLHGSFHVFEQTMNAAIFQARIVSFVPLLRQLSQRFSPWKKEAGKDPEMKERKSTFSSSSTSVDIRTSLIKLRHWLCSH